MHQASDVLMGFTASSFARISHVTGKRIIHDGMRIKTDFPAGALRTEAEAARNCGTISGVRRTM